MSKTVSARIDNGKHDALRDRCNLLGCTMNEFVSAAIEFAMYGTSEFRFGPEEIEEQVSQSETEVAKPIVAGKVRLVV